MSTPEHAVPGPVVSEPAVRGALLGVIDPELGDNVVDLGMYRGAEIEHGPPVRVRVQLALTTAACPLRGQLKTDIIERVGSLPGVAQVEVVMGEMDAGAKRALMDRARLKARDRAPVTDIPGRTRILAISSGKGGVGKSSVSVNLAAGLASRGLTVGLLDADIAGFSVPRMLDMDGELEAGPSPEPGGRPRIRPRVKPIGEGQLKVVSMGFLSGEEEAIMYRGLMLNRAVQHFLEDVEWGDLDYLVIDMPPGTGDIQMGLARMLPRAEMVIVTTPALAAQKVAARAADMARRGYLRVAGVIENMSGFTCDDGDHYDLFGVGGGRRLSEDIGVPLLAQIPLSPSVSAGGDLGRPVSLGSGHAAKAFTDLVDAVLDIAPLVAMEDCSARLFHVLDQTLGPVKSQR